MIYITAFEDSPVVLIFEHRPAEQKTDCFWSN